MRDAHIPPRRPRPRDQEPPKAPEPPESIEIQEGEGDFMPKWLKAALYIGGGLALGFVLSNPGTPEPERLAVYKIHYVASQGYKINPPGLGNQHITKCDTNDAFTYYTEINQEPDAWFFGNGNFVMDKCFSTAELAKEHAEEYLSELLKASNMRGTVYEATITQEDVVSFSEVADD